MYFCEGNSLENPRQSYESGQVFIAALSSYCIAPAKNQHFSTAILSSFLRTLLCVVSENSFWHRETSALTARAVRPTNYTDSITVWDSRECYTNWTCASSHLPPETHVLDEPSQSTSEPRMKHSFTPVPGRSSWTCSAEPQLVCMSRHLLIPAEKRTFLFHVFSDWFVPDLWGQLQSTVVICLK